MIESLVCRANEISGNTVEAQKCGFYLHYSIQSKCAKREGKLVKQIRGMKKVERGKQLFAALEDLRTNLSIKRDL